MLQVALLHLPALAVDFDVAVARGVVLQHHDQRVALDDRPSVGSASDAVAHPAALGQQLILRLRQDKRVAASLQDVRALQRVLERLEFLDPRLHGRVGGKVTVKRVSDFGNPSMGYSKRLRLEKGNISFTDNSSEGQAITGQLSGIKGLCTIPDKYGVITNATMTGTMVYKNVSTDHLLFEAEMTVTPTFEISYECSVE